jgi:NADPH:quinone reductase-like Zn-dependent oxidoreductase
MSKLDIKKETSLLQWETRAKLDVKIGESFKRQASDRGEMLMKAVLWTRYGSPDALKLQQIDKPIPKDYEVLIRVHASTVTAGDCEMRELKFPIWLWIPIRIYNGLLRPMRVTILGQELSGEIEAVGKGVTKFKAGDQVFATTGFATGAYAEYVCLPEDAEDGVLASMPANLSYEEAAGVPTGGLEALHFLRKANLRHGQQILINGAGGSIGTYGVQLARYFGAEVTAVDSTGKLNMLRSIGANHVIDYTKEDFTKSGRTYDVIFDVIGKSPFSGSIKSLKENGVYLIANPQMSKMIRWGLASRKSGKKAIFEMTKQKTEDLLYLKGLIEAGKIKPVIDRCYPLSQTAEGHRYVETGNKMGNVVITV